VWTDFVIPPSGMVGKGVGNCNFITCSEALLKAGAHAMSASSGTSFAIPVCPWATPPLKQACVENYTNLGNSLAHKVNSICVCGSVRQHIWEPSLSCTHGSQWEGALHICLRIQHAVGHKARIISILQKGQLITWQFNLTSKVGVVVINEVNVQVHYVEDDHWHWFILENTNVDCKWKSFQALVTTFAERGPWWCSWRDRIHH